MKIEAIALQLRPRTMSEAGDLGVRLVQAHARSVWACYLPVWALVVLIAFGSGGIALWLPSLVIFWMKPWLDRTLLFVLSRAMFGDSTRLKDVWLARSSVWWQQWGWTLTIRRLSFWRAYTLPVAQLEGQRGKAAGQRRRQLLQGHRGAAFGMHAGFAQLETLLMIGSLVLAVWLTPDNLHQPVWDSVIKGSGEAVQFALTALYALLVLLIEPFYVGAGFAMYLNRRVELEAWDIEQEFRMAFSS
jgi:hypothetical protein